ncbi:sulfate adenylyltransferase [Candidatus Magnetomoraceae bacterium gMMP-15]
MNDYSESLLVHFRRVESLKKEALNYPSIDLNKRQLCDLELLLNRAFYPLTGYLNQDEYESVLDIMRLPDSTIWPMPVCLDVKESIALSLEKGSLLALGDEEGFLLAVLSVEDIWKPDKKQEAISIFGTDDPEKHPGTANLYENINDWYIGGRLEGIHIPVHYDFKPLRLTPSETHRIFSQNGWRKVIGFHSEKPLLCAHKEMTLLAARKVGASIFMQSVAGLRYPGDLDHYTMVRCYQEIIKKYPRNMILSGLIPLAIRRAGPREALWQAVILKNYGCTHFMVEEDHADPFAVNGKKEKFYPLNAAREMVKDYEEETDILMVPLKKMVYVEDRAQYIPEDEVKPEMNIKHISSSELKRRLDLDLDIPEWFSYPEVVKELRYAYPPRSKQGFTIFMTGLSGSGKSTLAKVLMVKFMEMRTRPVTLLDGDIVRKNLSSELNFSKEHRDLNIRRIGFVASEITKNGGIAICAPIAPYEESRQHNRELISSAGGYIEVYMSTSLEICEQRDRKGIYAKARAGIKKGVTGIDDPYIPPSNPEIIIDTNELTQEEAAQEVLLYLEEQGYVK